MGDNCSLDARENHWTMCNAFWISNDTSSEQYSSVNLAYRFRWQFHHRYFRMATYRQCDRHFNLVTTSITFDRWSCTITGIPVFTIWRRHSHILHSKAGTILTLQRFSTNCSLPINCKFHTERIFDISKLFRASPLSPLYYRRYIIWGKRMSAECAEVLNTSHLEIHQKTSKFIIMDSYFARESKITGGTKFVDLCPDMIRMYSLTVYLIKSRMGCCITINHFRTLLLLSIWDLIAR